jgi:hypothetical protein
MKKASPCATILGGQAAASQYSVDKANFNSPPNRLVGSASRSECIPGIEMPRECPPAFRSARAVAGTDSAKRRSVRPPIAIARVRCHVRCCVSRAKAQCGGHADLAGLTQRRNHGRPMRSQDDAVGVPALPASFRCPKLYLTCPKI